MKLQFKLFVVALGLLGTALAISGKLAHSAGTVHLSSRGTDSGMRRLTASIPWSTKFGSTIVATITNTTTDAVTACVAALGNQGPMDARGLLVESSAGTKLNEKWILSARRGTEWIVSATIGIHDIRTQISKMYSSDVYVDGGSETGKLTLCIFSPRTVTTLKPTSVTSINFTVGHDKEASDVSVITTSVSVAVDVAPSFTVSASFTTATAKATLSKSTEIRTIHSLDAIADTADPFTVCIATAMDKSPLILVAGSSTRVRCQELVTDSSGVLRCVQIWLIEVNCKNSSSGLPVPPPSEIRLMATALVKSGTKPKLARPSVIQFRMMLNVPGNTKGRALIGTQVKNVVKMATQPISRTLGFTNPKSFVTIGDYTCIQFVPREGKTIVSAAYLPCTPNNIACIPDEENALPMIEDRKIVADFARNVRGSVIANSTGIYICFVMNRGPRGVVRSAWGPDVAKTVAAKAKAAGKKPRNLGDDLVNARNYWEFLKTSPGDGESASSSSISDGSCSGSGCSEIIDTEIVATCPSDGIYDGIYVGCTETFVSPTVYFITIGSTIGGIITFMAFGVLAVSFLIPSSF